MSGLNERSRKPCPFTGARGFESHPFRQEKITNFCWWFFHYRARFERSSKTTTSAEHSGQPLKKSPGGEIFESKATQVQPKLIAYPLRQRKTYHFCGVFFFLVEWRGGIRRIPRRLGALSEASGVTELDMRAVARDLSPKATQVQPKADSLQLLQSEAGSPQKSSGGNNC